MTVSRIVVLKFPKSVVYQPIVCKLVKEYDLEFNILKAFVTPKEEGLMVLELIGDEDNYKKGIKFLKDIGVNIEPISQDVVRDEERCTHCGACVVICPTQALAFERPSMRVNFDSTKCIGCEYCILACPPRAMSLSF
ncbi:MAG TPA: 4Fe-4S dicluster domain-containing protein [bacterium (Candidatus Stahlbacteria)]|nr:4Fe-4S dicluster domain-containing protein [Candidatus Stahlbacteria bacterium]